VVDQYVIAAAVAGSAVGALVAAFAQRWWHRKGAVAQQTTALDSQNKALELAEERHAAEIRQHEQ
jgi:hypothetical protein